MNSTIWVDYEKYSAKDILEFGLDRDYKVIRISPPWGGAPVVCFYGTGVAFQFPNLGVKNKIIDLCLLCDTYYFKDPEILRKAVQESVAWLISKGELQQAEALAKVEWVSPEEHKKFTDALRRKFRGDFQKDATNVKDLDGNMLDIDDLIAQARAAGEEFKWPIYTEAQFLEVARKMGALVE